MVQTVSSSRTAGLAEDGVDVGALAHGDADAGRDLDQAALEEERPGGWAPQVADVGQGRDRQLVSGQVLVHTLVVCPTAQEAAAAASRAQAWRDRPEPEA